MKVFLSARYSRRDELRSVREKLQRMGFTITSRWLDTSWPESNDTGSSAAPPDYRSELAVKDLEDVKEAGCLIAFTEVPRSNGRGGRHVELGAALAWGKEVIVVGYLEDIFCHYPGISFHETTEDMLGSLNLTALRL